MHFLFSFFQAHCTRKRCLLFFCAVLGYVLFSYFLRLLAPDDFSFKGSKLTLYSAVLFAAAIYPGYLVRKWLLFYLFLVTTVMLPVVIPILYGYPFKGITLTESLAFSNFVAAVLSLFAYLSAGLQNRGVCLCNR